ncbi:DNA-binding MarR family transcriptional regulator/GNAT superfamily N-acetyltransferase [Kibdelosporangium banguiense]|uniref:DNA-binding MarR family transcriptional regulator/GNAT superfamily N-acetyltransferase n=1 Tax=Kibdelosporangium banguiense TaxID=1365924 RepID=A0ABS4TD03_9PSEU|nr:helix-turn-helix domain-containing GNAT family N-acetyltransferase [Kibdelosporangium banguiense]MBP2321935.1 DNA-binding MarR family transcriptional regulator/GNAT superfamily N-acetyltransferase [Kibdelosporangium banguiense]
MVPGGRIQAVRQFNRFYTKVLGVLDEGLHQTPYTLTETRVLFELSQQENTEVTALRKDLNLDAGYLSRMLTRFEGDGLISRGKSTTDGRRQWAGLTDSGRKTMALLNERSNAQVHEMLDNLSEKDQSELVDAMTVIQHRLSAEPRDRTVVLRPPRPGDYGWVIERHCAIYAQEYGWGANYEALVARIVADYADNHDATSEAAWIAEIDGERMGSIFCVRVDDMTAKLRLLLVEPSARGIGLGGRLVDECLRFAKSTGYKTIELWTNSALTVARRIYADRGFTMVGSDQHPAFPTGQHNETWRMQLCD